MRYKNSKKRVISLLVQFGELLLNITKLKTKNQQTLGLLTEALQINKKMLFLLRDNNTNVDFVQQIAIVMISFIKEVISKWLFRYQLTLLKAIEYNNLKSLCLQLEN